VTLNVNMLQKLQLQHAVSVWRLKQVVSAPVKVTNNGRAFQVGTAATVSRLQKQEQQCVAVGPGNVHFISVHQVSSDEAQHVRACSPVSRTATLLHHRRHCSCCSTGNLLIKNLLLLTNSDLTWKSVAVWLRRILSSIYVRSLMTVSFEMKRP